jgi:glutathione S-transferase
MSKTYMYPPPEDHKEDVLCIVGISLPCRVCAYIVKLFDLPVDLCAIDFATQLYSPELLELNPVHSLPFLIAYKGSEKVCINGSEAISVYLINKYRSKVPESFFPSEPLAAAKVNEKVAFIMNVAYRSTMYQYVYPTMGLMSECQYDACKRDFALDVVEGWAKANSSKFFDAEVTLADLCWYSLWLGNNWVKTAEGMDKLPWKHADVIDKYPASKAIIEACAALPGVKEVDGWCVFEGSYQIASITQWNDGGAFGMLKIDNMAKTRTFKFDGPTIHPNQVPYAGDAGKPFNVFEKI